MLGTNNLGLRYRGVLRMTMRAFVLALAGLACGLPGMFAWAAGTITHPFAGVTCIAREEACPRPVKMHILLCRDYQVCDAINLDGGGSTTLCMSDPVPRAVSVPVGLNGTPGTLRPVGSNLAIFAPPAKQ